MSCERFQSALADLAAGGPGNGDLEAHLGGCAACREGLAARRKALALAEAELTRLLAAEPSPGLRSRIRRALPDTSASRRPVGRPALAAAAVLLLAVGAVATWRGETGHHGSEATEGREVAAALPERSAAPLSPAGLAQPEALPLEEEGEPPPLPEPSGAFPEPSSAQPPPPPARASFAAEVLVPPGVEDALLRFAAGLQGRTVPPTSILVAEPSGTLNPPRPLHRVEVGSLSPDFATESDS